MCIALGACDPVLLLLLQEGSLPSDGSGVDPHATLLVVQPVTQTGQRRAENEQGGRGGAVVCQRAHITAAPLPCHILSSHFPLAAFLNPASLGPQQVSAGCCRAAVMLR